MVARHGRKSAAELAATNVVAGLFKQRPEPPEDLTSPQQEIWRKVAASEDPEFFATAALRGMLADYCRHRESAEQISSIINAFNPAWMKSAEGCKRYGELLKMRDLETRAAVSLCTKLRLTNQSRYVPHAASASAKNAAKGPFPWDE